MVSSVSYGLSEVVDEVPVILPPEIKYPEMITRKDTRPDGSITLSTPLAVYSNKQGVVVYLVGALHIGEKEYYEELNKRFSTYDVVLFEMVGGEDLQRVLHLVKRNNAGVITDEQKKELTNLTDRLKKENDEEEKFQKLLPGNSGKMINLTGWISQQEGIDYSPSHFIHADMTKAEMDKAQREKGETMIGFGIADAFHSLTNPDAASSSGMMNMIVSALRKKDKEQLKRLFIEGQMDGGGVVDQFMGNSILLEGRNDKCLEVFDRVVRETPQLRRIGIFYGAAHMTDLHRKLEERGYKFRAVEWISAWICAPK